MINNLFSARYIYWSIFVLASLTHLPNYFKLDGYSLTNWLLIVIVVIAIVSMNYKSLIGSYLRLMQWNTPFLLLLIFGFSITVFLYDGFLDKSAKQNLFIYVSFFILLSYSTINAPTEKIKLFTHLFIFFISISLVIETVELVQFGLAWGDNLVRKYSMHVDARSLSMVVLLSMGWFVSSWVLTNNKASFAFSLIGLILLYLSLSRTTLFLGLLLLTIGFVLTRFQNIKKELFSFIILIISFIMVTMLFKSPLQERYIGSVSISSDLSNENSIFIDLEDVEIDLSGRKLLWTNVWNSFVESIYYGKGIGSAEMVDQGEFWKASKSVQPCNDHLRILHDFGLTGYLILLSQICLWIWRIGKTYVNKASDIDKVIYLNAIFSIFSVSAIALTDNPLVYSYVMMPLAVIIGSALNHISKKVSS